MTESDFRLALIELGNRAVTAYEKRCQSAIECDQKHIDNVKEKNERLFHYIDEHLAPLLERAFKPGPILDGPYSPHRS